MRRRDFIILLAGAMTATSTLCAQQKARPVIGWLNLRSPPANPGDWARGPIHRGLSGPVESGLVTSLARPGGNLTGFTDIVNELIAKRLDLLSELVPQAAVIALLVNPKNQI